MATTYKDVVQRRLKEMGRNKFTAAREGGLERGFLNDFLIERKKSAQGENFSKLARALEWEPSQLSEALEGRWPNAASALHPEALEPDIALEYIRATIDRVFSEELKRIPTPAEMDRLSKETLELFRARKVLARLEPQTDTDGRHKTQDQTNVKEDERKPNRKRTSKRPPPDI